MGLYELARNSVKRSYSAHSAYKMLRDFRQLPVSRWPQTDAVMATFKVLSHTMLPMQRLFDLYEIVRRVNALGVPGDFVECGVWNGGAVGLMALANRRHSGPPRKLHLFDSFEGLPAPTPPDAEVYQGFLSERPDAPKANGVDDGPEPIGACKGKSRAEVEAFLVNHLRIDPSELVFHAGWFENTVPAARAAIDEIALLRLDGDWYESTKVCIENLYDRVARGGYVVIDDYGTFAGCRKAVDEFFSARSPQPNFRHSDADCVYFQKP